MEKEKSYIETICLDEDCVRILDQTGLPQRTDVIELRTPEEFFEAIYKLKVRGAPAIGVCAAMAMHITTRNSTPERFFDDFERIKTYLSSSRPTAVNLFWALERMASVVDRCSSLPVEDIKAALKTEAESIYNEDISVCRRIGEHGISLINNDDGLLTHCNAGRLAAVRYGTATAPMYIAHERGIRFKVYADETRPLLQGARLTAWELANAGMDVTLLCDNMSASLMSSGRIQSVFVGCDRVAANGDTANKIGTLMAALAAARYKVPFYVCAPTSTIDWSLDSGAEIVIENRASEEVTEMWYKERLSPDGIDVYNPAFDVTPHDLITAFVTEYGVFKPHELAVLKNMLRQPSC